jgi:hypothetical protein
MLPEAYQPIRQWLLDHFPECRGVEVSAHDDAAALLPAAEPVMPYVSGEPVVLFRVIPRDPAARFTELAIAKSALTGRETEEVLSALEREGFARQLRASPERRLFLDRHPQAIRFGVTGRPTPRSPSRVSLPRPGCFRQIPGRCFDSRPARAWHCKH